MFPAKHIDRRRVKPPGLLAARSPVRTLAEPTTPACLGCSRHTDSSRPLVVFEARKKSLSSPISACTGAEIAQVARARVHACVHAFAHRVGVKGPS